MNKKHIATAVLAVLFIIVVVVAVMPHSQHGNREDWIKRHGQYAAKTPDKTCINCHTKKRNETKENFCNKCHQSSGVAPVK